MNVQVFCALYSALDLVFRASLMPKKQTAQESSAHEQQLRAKVELHKARAKFWKKYAVIFAADCGAGNNRGHPTQRSVIAAIKRFAANQGDVCPE